MMQMIRVLGVRQGAFVSIAETVNGRDELELVAVSREEAASIEAELLRRREQDASPASEAIPYRLLR